MFHQVRLDPEMEYRAAHPGCVRLYDISLDEYRDVTQRDVDLLYRAAQNWGATREAIKNLSDATNGLHEKYMANVRSISGNSGADE